MHILLVNDDGISSPSLAMLCRAAAARGHQVMVCAPSTQQSGKSHSFTIFDQVRVHPAKMEGAYEAWAVDGTPVDCARLGIKAFAKTPIDLVISGINHGYNTGLATYVSGTVGAAREAAFQNVKAMAVSADYGAGQDILAFFSEWIMTAAERWVTYDKAPAMTVCNLNIPTVPIPELKEPVMCPISLNVYQDGYERRVSPRGDIYFWVTEEIQDDHPAEGTDVYMLNQGHITCTFLSPEPCDQQMYRDFLEEM